MRMGVRWVITFGAVALGLGLFASCKRADFTLPSALIPMIIPQGRTATQAIMITRTNNFRGEVGFSIADTPPGLTARFSPEKLTSTGTQTSLTLTPGNHVPVGSYKIRIIATSGSTTKETVLEVRVEVGPDFSMTTTPTRMTLKQGASGTTTVDFSRNATFTGPIALTLEGAPEGITGTFSPASVSGSASSLNLAVAMAVAPGEYTLTIRGKGDGVERVALLPLIVEPSFSMLVAPASVTSFRGGRASPLTITLKRGARFSEPVALTLQQPPPGVAGVFAPDCPVGDTSTLTIHVDASVRAGRYALAVVGTAGAIVQTAPIELSVLDPFTISVEPAAIFAMQNTTTTHMVHLVRSPGFTDPVQLGLNGAPRGVGVSFANNPVHANSTTITLTLEKDAPTGTHKLALTATSGPVTQSRTLQVTVFTRERLTVSFPTAALGILHDWEKLEQVRDWIVHAFLVAREVPPEVIAVALHNQPPFRQPALSEVHTWQYGIGRWVWVDDDPMDTEPGDLYTFLPEGADHRLVGGLADDFRRATGTIPSFVHLVSYNIDEIAGEATFNLTTTWPGKELFAVGGPFGYRERVIRTRQDLDQFLKETDDLVYAIVEGGTLKLGGRDLPNRRPKVVLEDAGVLYQAYRRASPAVMLASLADALRQAYPHMSSSRASALASALYNMYTAKAKGDDLEASQAAEHAGSILALYGLTSEDTLEHVATLLRTHLTHGTESVGFSLDPDPDGPTFMDLARALYVAHLMLQPDPKRTGVTAEDWQLALYASEHGYLLPLHRIMQTLRNRDTEEARELYAVIATLLGWYACQCARYDGDIQGTQVGMTLFYCDLLAKLWMLNYEESAPRAVGMIPPLDLPIASLFWEEGERLTGGRLWFGASPARVGRVGTAISFSPIATRVFMAANDPAQRGKELPPSQLPEWMRLPNYCWEARWQEIMDHEPEYFRLNQIMKLSVLMSWLQEAGQLQTLGFLDREPVSRTSKFGQWLEANRGRLTLKAWLPFTGESATGTECLSLLFSTPWLSVGRWKFLHGGVSLAERLDLENLWEPAQYFAAMQGVLRLGKGTITDFGTKATYTFASPDRAAITPRADARFRAPQLELPLANVAFTWARTASHYRYSSTWTCKTGQVLDATVTFTRSGAGIKIEAGGASLAAQQLSRGLTEVPWEYIEAIYYDRKSGDLVFKFRAASGSFWLGSVRPQLGNVNPRLSAEVVEAASYNVGVQLLPQEPPGITTLPNVLQRVRTSVEELQKAPAACGIVDLDDHYLVITDRPDASFFMFPKDSQLAKALTGEDKDKWPKSLDDSLWQTFLEPFFRAVLSTLPETVGFRFTDGEGEVKVILETKARSVWPVFLFSEEMKRTLLDGRKIDVRLPPQGIRLVPESDPVLVETIYGC